MAILIISDRESDLSRILTDAASCKQVTFREAEREELSGYSALALLCGTADQRPRVLSAALRLRVEAFAESGKPVFYEWCGSFDYTYTVGDDYTDGRDSAGDAMNRYIYMGKDTPLVIRGDLLDSQANVSCVYRYIPADAVPVLVNGGHIIKHDHVDPAEVESRIADKDWRLWYYDQNRLVCSFRICDFVKARFAPFKAWCGILEIILKHLGVTEFQMPQPHYTLGSGGDARETFARGIGWFDGCSIVEDKGCGGAAEGLEHTILPDGSQKKRHNVRVDCVGEVAGAYFFDYLLNGKKESLEIYQNLSDFVFDKMQVKSGKFRGMLRWTESAWYTVFGDDTGRAVIPVLLYMMYTGDRSRFSQVEEALDFLLTVTGTDGLMKHGLNAYKLTDEVIGTLHSEPSNQYCAHRKLITAQRFCWHTG